MDRIPFENIIKHMADLYEVRKEAQMVLPLCTVHDPTISWRKELNKLDYNKRFCKLRLPFKKESKGKYAAKNTEGSKHFYFM